MHVAHALIYRFPNLQVHAEAVHDVQPVRNYAGCKSICSNGRARSPCCVNTSAYTRRVVQPCTLYSNIKSPTQQLFTGTAAAALYLLTGTPQYRKDADKFYGMLNPFLYYNNWSNVVAQARTGLSVLCTRAFAE
jgi:hypothetical protein